MLGDNQNIKAYLQINNIMSRNIEGRTTDTSHKHFRQNDNQRHYTKNLDGL